MYKVIGIDQAGKEHNIAKEKSLVTAKNSNGWKTEAKAVNATKTFFEQYEKVYLFDSCSNTKTFVYPKPKAKNKHKEVKILTEEKARIDLETFYPIQGNQNDEADCDPIDTKSYDADFLRKMAYFTKNKRKIQDELFEQIQHEDLVECDLMHAFEFFTFDYIKQEKLCEKMKESRIRRRNAKDLFKAISILENDPEGCITYLSQLDQRNYHPRILTSLFENEKEFEKQKIKIESEKSLLHPTAPHCVLLSIRPEYVEAILAGTKKFEFRKWTFSDSVDTIFLYATSPVKRILGEAKIADRIEGTPEEVWEKFKADAGVSKEDFFTYFGDAVEAFAYKLTNVVRYKKPKTLADFGVDHAPQTFTYVENEV